MAVERIVPGTAAWTMYHASHVQRYMFAAAELAPRSRPKVLDVAAGVGYGARHLAEAGARVTAVDRDSTALRCAQEEFGHPDVVLRQDECDRLDQAAADAPFDAVVSFETIEHLRDPLPFLRRCAALMADEGTLIASTPNVKVSLAESDTRNRYHERELTALEFLALLRGAGFGRVALYGQQYTAIGRLRRELRAEMHIVRSTPVVRLSLWLQTRLRGRRFSPALPERLDDFEIAPLPSAEAAEALGASGPFVLIAVARR